MSLLEQDPWVSSLSLQVFVQDPVLGAVEEKLVGTVGSLQGEPGGEEDSSGPDCLGGFLENLLGEREASPGRKLQPQGHATRKTGSFGPRRSDLIPGAQAHAANLSPPEGTWRVLLCDSPGSEPVESPGDRGLQGDWKGKALLLVKPAPLPGAQTHVLGENACNLLSLALGLTGGRVESRWGSTLGELPAGTP
jgi:hypothetical protein